MRAEEREAKSKYVACIYCDLMWRVWKVEKKEKKVKEKKGKGHPPFGVEWKKWSSSED